MPEEVAVMAGVETDDVFYARNFLDDVDPISVMLIAMVLHVNLGVLE